ncbi:MAG: hypothetical protein FWD12_07045, partial [Alphaproteobacteria bacterium]|nr:hypothetical protein [Alphaproteobacteria bacterium]
RAPGHLPRRLKDVLFFDEPAPLDYRRPPPPPPTPQAVLQHPIRGDVRQQVVKIDDLVALDHPVRSVWKFSDSLDLAFLADAPGGPAKPSPALIFSLWLWAAAEGIGSAGHIARLCEYQPVYRWLCGGVPVDRQILLEARTAHRQRFERLLAHALAALLEERLLPVELMPIDAQKDLGSLKRSTPQRRLKVLVSATSDRVQQLREALDRDDPVADESYMWAIANGVVQEREKRVTAALGWMKEIADDDDGRAPSKRRAPARPNKGLAEDAPPARRRTKVT